MALCLRAFWPGRKELHANATRNFYEHRTGRGRPPSRSPRASTNLLSVYLPLCPLYPDPNFLRFRSIARFLLGFPSLKHDPPASPRVIERKKREKKKIHVHAHVIKVTRVLSFASFSSYFLFLPPFFLPSSASTIPVSLRRFQRRLNRIVGMIGTTRSSGSTGRDGNDRRLGGWWFRIRARKRLVGMFNFLPRSPSRFLRIRRITRNEQTLRYLTQKLETITPSFRTCSSAYGTRSGTGN